jgi:agmatine deiminase
MKKNIRFLVFSSLIFCQFSCKNDLPSSKIFVRKISKTEVRLPAEFEPQSAVWLLFPQMNHIQNLDNQEVTREIALLLAEHILVKLVVPSDSMLEIALKILPENLISSGKIELIKMPYQEFWARDMGPCFVKMSDKNGEKLAIADFNFNGWGYADSTETSLDESLDERIAASTKIWGIGLDGQSRELTLRSQPLVHEGGNHESNGRGTLIVTEAVERQRNPTFSLAEIERQLKILTGATNIIFLKSGVHEDDLTFLGPIFYEKNKKGYTLVTTGGHIDEFCRFVNDSTVVLAEVDSLELLTDPIAQENKKRLDENLQILQKNRLENGRPIRVVRMPMPPTTTRKIRPGDWVYDVISELNYPADQPFPKGKSVVGIAAASYCNFLITNELVIGQRYFKTGMSEKIREKDARAEAILKSLFTDRKVILIDALAVNFGGGGVHCITMNQPALKPILEQKKR